MFSVLKFMIAFCFSFVLLSIPIQQKPMFYYLNDWASPITQEIFSSSKQALMKGVKSTKKIGNKMFNNTRPEQDKINVQSSSVNKKSRDYDHELEHEIEGIKHSDEYTDEEKNMLNQILLNHK